MTSRPLNELFNIETPWWKRRIYYPIYRFYYHNLIFHPRRIYKEAKWLVQRGRRGWADCDTWSLDYYLSSWLPDALAYLRDHKHSIPATMFPSEGEPDRLDEDMEYSIAEFQWDTALGNMIGGFRALQRINNVDYGSELDGCSWKKDPDEWSRKVSHLEKRDRKIFKIGMKVFVEYFECLWD